MARNRPTSRKRLSADATELSYLAAQRAESGGRLEDAFWEKQIAYLIDKLLENSAEDDLSAALDHLFESNLPAHSHLANLIESRAESVTLAHKGDMLDVLLINIPLLAWSRFSIPTGTIPKTILETLAVQLGAHVFAANAKLSLADYLYSPDQLPRSFVETRRLTLELGRAAIARAPLRIDASALPETNPFLSDTRYLVGAIVVPTGDPLFRWNEADRYTREASHDEWIKQGAPCLEPLLTGCAVQPLLADAYHAACRFADIASRPYSLRSSVAFLQAALGMPADAIVAVVGAFYDDELEEYRIGFGLRGTDTIFHGIVWPLLGDEDENTDLPGEIEHLLLETGVEAVILHEQRFPFEFCEDCGAPLYPNPDGETVHAEMPNEDGSPSQTLH